MLKFLTRELISGQGVELSDALSVGGMVTGSGLGIVFSVLVILMFVLLLFKVFFYKKEDTTASTTEAIPQPAPKEEKFEMPEDKIVAVLVAAIAASQEVPMEKIRIKSIKKI